jgi:2-dehydropantoate 2-reductase
MHVLVLGAGALGGYYGGRLQQGGADVTFLVRAKRGAQLARDGLRIESGHGKFHQPVKTALAADAVSRADVVLLTCKAYDLPGAIEAIRPAVGPKTAVLPLLNGLAHMETLNAAFSSSRVLGGLAKIQATLTPEGVIKTFNDWRYVTFGEQSGEMTARIDELHRHFARTPVIAKAVPNIMAAMWEKLVHLATAAGVTSLMRASIGEIARTPHGSQIMIDLLETNARVAALEGHEVSSPFMDEFRTLLANPHCEYSTSMLRDIERHGPIEADHIHGFMLDNVRKHGLDDRMHLVVLTHLKAYEQRRAAGRL